MAFKDIQNQDNFGGYLNTEIGSKDKESLENLFLQINKKVNELVDSLDNKISNLEKDFDKVHLNELFNAKKIEKPGNFKEYLDSDRGVAHKARLLSISKTISNLLQLDIDQKNSYSKADITKYLDNRNLLMLLQILRQLF